MDTLNNDFQVKLLFSSRASEDHIMHLMGCDTYLSVITFFSCLCHFQSAEVFSYIFLKCSWLLKIRNWPFPKLKLKRVINSRSENEKFAS